MIEFLTVSSVNADNRKGDIFPSSCGQSVGGAQAHEPWGQFFYSHTLNFIPKLSWSGIHGLEPVGPSRASQPGKTLLVLTFKFIFAKHIPI